MPNYELRTKLREAIAEFEGDKTLVNISESIAYLLIDIGATALKLDGEIDEKIVESIAKSHYRKPTLAAALFLQGSTMLGWLDDESILSSTLITKTKEPNNT